MAATAAGWSALKMLSWPARLNITVAGWVSMCRSGRDQGKTFSSASCSGCH